MNQAIQYSADECPVCGADLQKHYDSVEGFVRGVECPACNYVDGDV